MKSKNRSAEGRSHASKNRGFGQFSTRLPLHLIAKIDALAAVECRSRNAQLTFMIREFLRIQSALQIDKLDDKLLEHLHDAFDRVAP